MKIRLLFLIHSLSENYGKDAVQVVDEAGFESAFSVNSCRVDRHSNIFEIPLSQFDLS